MRLANRDPISLTGMLLQCETIGAEADVDQMSTQTGLAVNTYCW